MNTLAIDCRMASKDGIGVYIRNMVPLCMQGMEDCHFILLGYAGSFLIPPGISWDATPFSVLNYSLQEQLVYPSVLKGADALWCPHSTIPLLSQIPTAVTVHDLAHLALPSAGGRLKRLRARLFFHAIRRKAHTVVTVSQFTQSEFLARVGKPRGTMSVVLNGVSNDWYPHAHEPEQTTKVLSDPYNTDSVIHAAAIKEDHSCLLKPNPFFLALGSGKPHKNIPLLCRAFASIAPRCKANLYIVGDYSRFRSFGVPVETLEALYPGRIFFCEQLADHEVQGMMRRASALIFPSHYEGFGLPPLEAMATGLPIIASDIPPVHEVCGPDAYYCNPKSEDDFAKAMLDVLILDSAQRQHIAQRNRKRAMLFSWDNAATKTAALLRQLLQ